MTEPVHVDTWRLNVRRWLVGDIGPEGEQLALPGMPVPPRAELFRSLLGWLPSYANWKDGRDIAVSVETLARLLGCSERSVRRGLKEMRAFGLAELTKRHNQHAPDRYALTDPKWSVPDTGDTPELSTGKLVPDTGDTYQPARPVAEQVGTGHSKVGSGHLDVGTGHRGYPTSYQLPEGGASSSPDTAPSPFCSTHPQGTEDDCGPCGGARRRYAAWQEQEAAERARRNSPRRAVEALADEYYECCGNPVNRPHVPGCAAAA
jgi:hypothetical protein